MSGPPRRQRTLRDLNVLGRTVTFDDPLADAGRQIVWLQKLSPADHASAVRKANAARARVRVACEDHNGDEYMALVDEFDVVLRGPDLVDMLIAEDRQKIAASVEAELEHGEGPDGEPTEWGRDDYLQGLRDAWIDTARELYIADENDPDARRILDEFARFSAEATAIIEPQVADLRAQIEALPADSMRERGLERFVKLRAEQAWIDEFEKCEVWLGTRKACEECRAGKPHSFVHDAYYFATGRKEIDELDDSIRDRLISEFHTLATEVIEGKGSPGNPASSDSSASPEPPVEATASGPEAATG